MDNIKLLDKLIINLYTVRKIDGWWQPIVKIT